MSVNSFDELLQGIGSKITYLNTKWRNSVAPEQRLSVTLRYLATGNSFNSLHFKYLLGATTVREIVKDICEQIWICVHPEFMPDVSEDSWLNIATQVL
ncbi:unnamed protein product [Acanthoscelides obtectus]|uniref:Uncharacterized protein n=1 Tax=Acanthoscelides obtectus TaxID=200917 RepID=A0A9P0LJQ9_ACAOB|nr:unnamed protein product [Acanthoscelides obtectus]CAK1632950.1 hypothetical protein AOBTE_LOCUS7843 [Acanthoscelides obtectus]